VIAYRINSISQNSRQVFALVPPYNGHTFVVSSYVSKFTEPETLIFACDNEGKVLDWTEITGTREDEPMHLELIKSLGYTEIYSLEEVSGIQQF
jgi:hypothetical protein